MRRDSTSVRHSVWSVRCAAPLHGIHQAESSITRARGPHSTSLRGLRIETEPTILLLSFVRVRVYLSVESNANKAAQ